MLLTVFICIFCLKERQPIFFQEQKARPVLLCQTMGAETGLQVGDEVEALKPGRFYKETWIPSMWKKATVVASNYDGTYDIQFEMKHGPYREQMTLGAKGKGHKRVPTLSLRRNEQFKDFGADHMPASFRLFQEMNYQLSMHPKNIRLPGSIEALANVQDIDAMQDWYLCTNMEYIYRGRSKTDEKRLTEYARRFIFNYRWVPTPEGDLRFEPVPNAAQALALRTSHKDTTQQFASLAQVEDDAKKKVEKYKTLGVSKYFQGIVFVYQFSGPWTFPLTESLYSSPILITNITVELFERKPFLSIIGYERQTRIEMKQCEQIIGDLKIKPDKPLRPAGPRVMVS